MFSVPAGCRTELTEAFGASIDVPNLPKCPVPVSCCTEITKVSGTGMKACTSTDGTGIYVVPNLPKCPVPVLMS